MSQWNGNCVSAPKIYLDRIASDLTNLSGSTSPTQAADINLIFTTFSFDRSRKF